MLHDLIERTVADLDVMPDPAQITAVSQLLLQAPAGRLLQLRAQGAPDGALVMESAQLGIVPILFAKKVKDQALALSQILRAGTHDGRALDPFARLGLTTVLCHLVRPSGPLSHDLPGRYGFLDDWLYLTFGAIEYLGWKPSGEQFENIRRDSETVTGLLPVHIAMGIQAVMAQSQAELAMLRGTFGHVAGAAAQGADALIANPVPQPFLALQAFPPAAQAGAAGGGGGRWHHDGAGNASTSFQGGSYTRFSDGSSVGMVGDKILATFR